MLSCFFGLSQSQQLEHKVTSLKAKLVLVDSTQKLKLLDSLCDLTRDRPDLQYDSIVKITVDYAIALDSFDLATRQAARLVWSLSNRQRKPEEATRYFESFKNRNLPITNKALMSRFYLNGGDGYYFSGQVETAIKQYQLASQYALAAKDTLLFGISKKYTADAFSKKGKLAEASALLQEVESIYRLSGDTIRIINTRSSRADLYSMGGFYQEAKKERDAVILMAKKANYLPGLLAALANEAIDLGIKEDRVAQIESIKSSLSFVKNTDLYDQYEPNLKVSLIKVYAQSDSLLKAQVLYSELIKDPERYMTGYNLGDFKQAEAILKLKQGEFDNAISAAYENYEIQKRSQVYTNLLQSHRLLSQIYEQKGDAKNALIHFKAYHLIQDSITGDKQSQALTYYQTLYETEKQEAKIASQYSEIAILDAKNRIKTWWIIFVSIGLLALFVIAYLARTKQFSRRKQHLHRLFSRNLIKNQEEERHRISRELHDGVGQKMILLTKKVSATNDPEITSLATDSLSELRAVARGLHPSILIRLGLNAAIIRLIEEFDATSDSFFTHDIDAQPDSLSADDQLHLYRIIQETISNSLKHAKASTIYLELNQQSTGTHLLIADNGIGFDVQQKIRDFNTLGMRTLFERAKILGAKLHLESDLGTGTQLTMVIPNKSA
ncbi:MAG: sensor histidine kinase [Gilvibacter sp.]